MVLLPRTIIVAILVGWPLTNAVAQYRDPDDSDAFGRRGARGDSIVREEPIITSVLVRGPLPPADFRQMFALDPSQQAEYQQVFDSFTVATREPREAAVHRLEQLDQALGRDTAAVTYYKERLKELSRTLKDAQSRFDDRMKKLLSRDQQKQYREWRKKEDETGKKGGSGGSPGKERPPGRGPR